MSDVTNTVTTKYVVDNRDAIRETERLARAQQKSAADAAKAMDAFSRDATAALGKVDKSIAAQEKAWAKAQKAMEEGGSTFSRAFDKAKGAADGFNRVVGLANQTLGNIKAAIDLGTTAVNLLGKAWTGLSDALGSSPQLRMMWEKSPHEQWIKMFEEKTKAAQAWSDAMQVSYFGADVDSPANMARRIASREKVAKQKEAAGFVGMRNFQQYLDAQTDAAEKFQKDWEAFQAQARPFIPKKGGGGGAVGRSPADDYRLMMAAARAMAQLQAYVAGLPGVDPTAMGVLGADYQGNAGGLGGLDWGGDRLTNAGSSLLDSVNRYSAESGIRVGGGTGVASGSVQTPTILQRMFGEADEIDRYTRAWATLEDAVTSGYEALITGSESAGAAMKRIIGQSIMAGGSRMLVLALRESAFAVAQLASGNFASAATHGKSALMFGAGAAAAGVAARALGVGGGSTAAAGASAGGSTTVSGTGGAVESGPVNRTFVIGDSFGFESPRDQARRFATYQRKTAALESVPTGVQYQ